MKFLSRGNSILLFRALLKFLKFWDSNFFKEKPCSCSWKLIFWLVEIFFYFSDTPASESCFLSSGNVFLNEFFISYGRDGFLCLVETIFSYLIFFLQVEAVTEINGSFFGKDFIPASRKGFSVQRKLFSFILCFLPASGNR